MTTATKRRRVKPIITHEKPVTSEEYPELRGTFDAADHTAIAWKNVAANFDAISPNNAASLGVRRKLRNWARYEFKNNSYCRGMVWTMAYDTVGTGPRLQMLTKNANRNATIEKDFKKWAKETKLTQKLQQYRVSRAVDGEPLAITRTNRRLQSQGFPVALDWRLLECDQLHNPRWQSAGEDDDLDGIELNELDEPIRYHILDHHPGAGHTPGSPLEGQWYPRNRVIFLPYTDRSGQVRGVPELTPALPLFTILRRYTLAVLGAAETAADYAAVLQSTATAEKIPTEVEPFLEIPLKSRVATTIPFGWMLGQVKAEQPTTTYPEFKRQLLSEISRCLHMPYNIGAADSSQHNYASGRLDHQVYHRSIVLLRQLFVDHILDFLFGQWIREYIAETRGTRMSNVDPDKFPHRWVWDPFPHVDPEKEANADIAYWEKGLITDDDFLIEKLGKDPEMHYEQAERMMKRREELGLPRPGIAEQSIKVDDSSKAVV